LALTKNPFETDLLGMISDEHGRLAVWGKNSGANRMGRGSLDDRLRNDAKLCDIVRRILDSLITCIAEGMYLTSQRRRIYFFSTCNI
jgi:hypothetical protein